MNLPSCHSRRSLESREDVFFCAHPNHHSEDSLVTKEICWICPLWQQPPPPVFRKFPPDPVPPGRPSIAQRAARLRHEPCVFLGEQVGLRDCPSCGGFVRVKVFACSHPRHQETTLTACARCPDYECRTADV
jgi:hypothetical protein